MARPNKKIEELQHHCWIALSNAERIEAITKALDEAGFDQTRRDELRQLLAVSKKRVRAYNIAYDRQMEMTGQRDEQHQAMDQLFALHRRQSRRLLKRDSPPYRKLGLGKERSRRLLTWFQQCRSFYGLLLEDEDYQGIVTRYRLSPAFLTETLNQIGDLESLHQGQQTAMRKARQSTKERDTAADALAFGYLDMKDIAMHALKSQPQYLEVLGIAVVV